MKRKQLELFPLAPARLFILLLPVRFKNKKNNNSKHQLHRLAPCKLNNTKFFINNLSKLLIAIKAGHA